MPRKKWNPESWNVKVGDFVIVADPNTVRGKWHMGKVVQVFPGEDSLVRNVQVKMATAQQFIIHCCPSFFVRGEP